MVEVAEDEYQEVAGIAEDVQAVDAPSTLAGIGSDYTVEVLNPLSVPFRAKFARSVIQAPRLSNEQAEHQRKMAGYGIPMSKESPQGHVPTYLLLKPGQTLKLPGDVAQVVVRQLVNEILQRTKQVRGLSDATARMNVEKEIIINYSSIVQSVTTATPQEAFEQQLEELNNPKGNKEVATHAEERPFPGLTEASTTGSAVYTERAETARKPDQPKADTKK